MLASAFIGARSRRARWPPERRGSRGCALMSRAWVPRSRTPPTAGEGAFTPLPLGNDRRHRPRLWTQARPKRKAQRVGAPSLGESSSSAANFVGAGL